MGELSEQLTRRYSANFSAPTPGVALVAEGGGQRGVFTAGVLDAWLVQGYMPFELMIGSSAGAQNLSSYLTGQKGFARHSIFSYTQAREFFSVKRGLAGKSVVNLDWYFAQQGRSNYRLALDVIEQRLQQRRLLISATHAQSRRARFFQPNADNCMVLLKASSALPLLYKDGVEYEGERFVDGGLAAPIPVREAYQQGARTIVVIRTQPQDAPFESPWVHKLKSWLCTPRHCPAVIDLMSYHENAYRKALAFINKPPKGANIIQICPRQPLKSRLVGSEYSQLELDYQQGVEVGLAFLAANVNAA